MTGPLAQQFEDVRAALDTLHYYGAAERHSDDDCPVCGSCDEGYAALSAIERHVQDMETALEEIPGKPPYRIAGIPSGIISADDWDATDEVLAFLAALPASGTRNRVAREKGTRVTEGMTDDERERWYGGVGYPDE